MYSSNTLHKLSSNYQVPFYLRSATMQTIWGSLVKKNKKLPWKFYTFPLADGDFHECAVIGNTNDPVWLFVPGMGGDWQSAAIVNVVSELLNNGWQVAVMNHRGFGTKLNYKLATTHAGNYQDLASGIINLRNLRPGIPVYGCGISLGASQMLHYLTKEKIPLLEAACAISTPFDLSVAQSKTPWLYQYYIMRDIRMHYLRKYKYGMKLPITIKELQHLHTFREYDRLFTAPLHGFSSVDDYYQKSSSLPLVYEIAVPTLLVQAQDDPFIPGEYCPQQEDLPAAVQLLLLNYGGHGGFWGRCKSGGLKPYWLQVAEDFFRS